MDPTFSGDGMMPTISGMGPDGTDSVSGMEPSEPTQTASATSPTPTTTPTIATTPTVRGASPPMTGTMTPTRSVRIDGTVPTNDFISNPVHVKNNDNVPQRAAISDNITGVDINRPASYQTDAEANVSANSTVSPTKDEVKQGGDTQGERFSSPATGKGVTGRKQQETDRPEKVQVSRRRRAHGFGAKTSGPAN